MSVRYKRGLEVATDTYEKDGRTVTLIGVSHIADKDFWATTQALISDREAEGASVHYELIERDIEGPRQRTFDMKTLAPVLGMQFQFDGLNYKDSWTRTDMTASEFLAHATRRGPKAPTEEQLAEVLRVIGGSDKRRRVTRWFMMRLLLAVRYLPLPGPMGVPLSIVLGVRNLIAAKAALEASGDVVAIWGAAHLPGIGKILRDHGFVRTAREWTTAISRSAK
jgi:hypothetical protein